MVVFAEQRAAPALLNDVNVPVDVMLQIMLTQIYVRVFLAAWDAVSATVTRYNNGVLVGPITDDMIRNIEGLVTGVKNGRSNLTVKDVVDALMVVQNQSIEKHMATYKFKKTG